ncbi:MAG: hypothetical protein QM705_15530 [Ancrocorticia sp.]
MNVDRSEGESLIAVLDELIELVSNAPTTMMSAAVKLNRSEILDLLATARDLVPDQIVRADGLLAEADGFTHEAQARASRIIEQAHNDAEDTIAEAREQASRLVSQDAITIAAKARAHRIIDDAKSQADKLRRGANEYSDNTLFALQNKVSEVGSEIDSLTSVVNERIDIMLSQIIAGRNVIAERDDNTDSVDVARQGAPEEESWT